MKVSSLGFHEKGNSFSIVVLDCIAGVHLVMTKLGRIVVAIFCLIAASVLYKVEVIDHGWIVYERDAGGFVGGWYTPEDAVTKDQRWKNGKWDFEIVTKDSFRVRQHVDPIVGYLIPIALLGFAALVTLVPGRPDAKSVETS